MTYIQQQKPSEGCIFCQAVNAEDTPENLIVRRGQYAFVILNLFPYTTGHVMVVPFQHSPLLEQLSAEISAEMM